MLNYPNFKALIQAMIKYIYTALLLILLITTTFAQPSNTIKKHPVIDTFCDNLQLILKNSKDGFIAYRYKETQQSATITYNTTLPALGFSKKFVQTGNVNPHKQTTSTILPYFIATSDFADIAVANHFFSAIKTKIKNCLKPFAQDSTIKSGFTRYTSFQIAKQVKDSFITIELILLADAKINTVALRLFHSKASAEKGNMKNPPVVMNTNKNHYTHLPQLLQKLIDYSPNNFTAIRGTLLQNQEWTPTYSSIVSFRDLAFPKIEYVTKNLWNQYSTNLFIKDKAASEQRFLELAAEIEQCKSSFPYQRYENASKPFDKWWYYDNPRIDVEGKKFKNTLRLGLKKFEYGEGYYLTFEFRKSAG